MSYRRAPRLAWALMVSVLLHLAIVADITHLQWPLPTGLASRASPLEVHFFPVSSDRPISAPAKQHRRSVHARPGFQFIQNEIIPDAVPRPENVASANPSGVTPEPTFGAPPVTPLVPVEEEPPSPRLPANGRLVYQFYWGKSRWLAGHAIHEWVVKDGYYTLSSSVNTTGLFALLHPTRLVETAKGLVIGNRLRPLQFSTQLNDYPPLLAFFNWEKGYFRWYRGNSPTTQALPAGSYDKISFLYQLSLARQQPGASTAYITTGDQLERYDIEDLGQEKIEIDGKTLDTTHLRKAASAADPSVIELWLARDLGLPVKITHTTRGGDHFEQLLAPGSLPAD